MSLKKAQVRIHNHSLGSWAVLIWLSLVFYSTLGPCDGENALFARKDKTLDRILSMQSSTGFYQKPREKYTGRGLRKPPVFETWIWSVTANIQQLVKPQAVRLLHSPQTCSPIDSII